MTSINFNKGLGDISDPSDWKNTTIPLLSQLDSLQRCYICKEFLLAPVVTSCNHTFCSTCIRQHLMSKNSCPLCKSEQFESNLRRVVVLEEIVNCFTSLRPFILEKLSRDESKISDNDMKNKQQRTPDRSNESTETSLLPLKRKSESLDNSNGHPEVVVISDDDQHDQKKIKIASGEAQCPICSKWMESSFLQSTHIDNCLNGKSSILPKDYKSKVKKPSKPNKKEISSFFKPLRTTNNNKDPNDALKINHEDYYFNRAKEHNQKENRLPKLDFSSLTFNKLKEKLTLLGLSSNGTRNQLEIRYNHYYILYNSNLDSNHPVDIRVLKLRLNKWESSHLAFNPTGNTSNLFSSINSGSLSTKPITDKNFPVGQWKKMFAQEFRELKKQAISNMKMKANRPDKDDKPHSDKPSTKPHSDQPHPDKPSDKPSDQPSDKPHSDKPSAKPHPKEPDQNDLAFETSPLFVSDD